nr:unnamed protein product [Callosobruchus chinensis]
MITEIINLNHVIFSILQDIENSMTFAKMGVMHPSVPSIIKPLDLLQVLNLIVKKLSTSQLPIEVTLENIPIFEKLIRISCYTVQKKVT